MLMPILTGLVGYIGPGAGLSLGGALLGLLLTLLAAFSFTLFWPIRALYRKFRPQQPAPLNVTTEPPSNTQSSS